MSNALKRQRGFSLPETVLAMALMVLIGGLFVIETGSVIVQRAYFKLTHGKRVFKMSPFHHHLEMGGWTGHKWKETQIVALFAGVTVLFAVLSFIGVFHRFGA